MGKRKADAEQQPDQAEPVVDPKPDGELTMAEAVARANAEQRKVLSRDGWVLPG